MIETLYLVKIDMVYFKNSNLKKNDVLYSVEYLRLNNGQKFLAYPVKRGVPKYS